MWKTMKLTIQQKLKGAYFMYSELYDANTNWHIESIDSNPHVKNKYHFFGQLMWSFEHCDVPGCIVTYEENGKIYNQATYIWGTSIDHLFILDKIPDEYDDRYENYERIPISSIIEIFDMTPDKGHFLDKELEILSKKLPRHLFGY